MDPERIVGQCSVYTEADLERLPNSEEAKARVRNTERRILRAMFAESAGQTDGVTAWTMTERDTRPVIFFGGAESSAYAIAPKLKSIEVGNEAWKQLKKDASTVDPPYAVCDKSKRKQMSKTTHFDISVSYIAHPGYRDLDGDVLRGEGRQSSESSEKSGPLPTLESKG